MQKIQNKNLQKIWIKRAGKDAKAAPIDNAIVIGIKIGEYAAYLTGSKIPFLMMFWVM